MNISIIGAGNMAHAISTRVVAGKHSLTIFNRDGAKAKELADKIGGDAKGEELTDTLDGDLIIFTLPYTAIFEVIEKYKKQLAGKVIVDTRYQLNLDLDQVFLKSSSEAIWQIQPDFKNDGN